MTTIDSQRLACDGNSRIAYCKCGTRLVAESDRALREAAHDHIVVHHPHYLRGPSVVQNLPETFAGR